VLSGGTAENPVVLASSTEILLSGGSTITGTIDGGSLVVSSGGSESVLPAGGSGSIAGSNSIAAGGALTILGGPAVDAGGTLTIASGGVVTNAGELVIGGGAGGEIVSSAGQNLFLPNGGGGELTIGSGGTLTDSGTLTVEAGDPGISGGPNGGDGTLTDGGTLTIAGGGTLIDAGTVIIASGGLLDVQSGGVVDGGIDFSGAGGTLQIDSAPPFARLTFSSTLLEDAVVSGFAPGDTIDLTSVAYDSADQVTSASNELQIMADDGTFGLALDPAQNFAGDTFVFGLNSGSGTLITEEATPCYCRGTRILTDRGEVPVEELAIGDLVMTQDGWLRPIKWIGTRSYDGRFIRGNREVLPIVITAGSLDEGVPARDLWVSPEHALYIDRLLVPAKLLVNGMTITQAKVVERLEYFHLEFAEHEIILAECAPAESYVEIDNRWSFHNAEEYARLHPEDDRPSARECAPRLAPGMQELSDIRKKLFTRRGARLRDHRRPRPAPHRRWRDDPAHFGRERPLPLCARCEARRALARITQRGADRTRTVVDRPAPARCLHPLHHPARRRFQLRIAARQPASRRRVPRERGRAPLDRWNGAPAGQGPGPVPRPARYRHRAQPKRVALSARRAVHDHAVGGIRLFGNHPGTNPLPRGRALTRP
jgi:hypothetical protein